MTMHGQPVGVGANRNAEPITVAHAELTRFGDSAYASTCPACEEGTLGCIRIPGTLRLSRKDVCTFCGQHVLYTDETIAGEILPRGAPA